MVIYPIQLSTCLHNEEVKNLLGFPDPGPLLFSETWLPEPELMAVIIFQFIKSCLKS
jgi:hypothetical protein